MEVVTIGFIIILNLAAIMIFYKSLGKIETKNKIVISAIGILLMYIILYIIYNIASNGVDEKIVTASRQIIIFTFLPINIICMITPIAMQLRKLKQEEIDEDKFKRKIILFVIISIIIFIFECMYIKDIQTGIAKFEG